MWSQMPTREVQPAVVRHLDQAVERGEVALLLLAGDAHHPHVGESLDIEEVRIRRRQEAAVLVAEDHHQRVETVLGQQVEIAGPVGLVVEAALPVSPVHGVDGDGPLADGRCLDRFADFAQGLAAIGAPSDAVGDVQLGVHQAAIVAPTDDPAGLA